MRSTLHGLHFFVSTSLFILLSITNLISAAAELGVSVVKLIIFCEINRK